jgi:hypothetical protein
LEFGSEAKCIDNMAEWIDKMAEWIDNHESGIKRSVSPPFSHHRGLQWPAKDNHACGFEFGSEAKWIDNMAEWIDKMADWIDNHESGIKRSVLTRWLSGTKWSGVHWMVGEHCVVEWSEWIGKTQSSGVEWSGLKWNAIVVWPSQPQMAHPQTKVAPDRLVPPQCSLASCPEHTEAEPNENTHTHQ